MGQLATYLQQQFHTHCPPGWQVQHEAQLLDNNLRQMLGYAPQVDVLLTHETGRRLWLEFEISRADPVANHAKFATAHLFHPQTERDVFVSMITPHVSMGRRNLAANMIHVMRYIGMQAFQTALFPALAPQEIMRLNHLDLETLQRQKLNVKREIQRALDVSLPLSQVAATSIHFVANTMEAMLNLRRWNYDQPGSSLRHLLRFCCPLAPCKARISQSIQETPSMVMLEKGHKNCGAHCRRECVGKSTRMCNAQA